MDSDQTLIETAYAGTIKGLYDKLFDGYVTAGGDTALEQQAEQRFLKGVGFARSSRDRAIALLAQPAAAAGS
jgi:hypothetical protein